MQVTVKLFGALSQFLPPGSGFNSCQLTLAENPVLTDVLGMLAIPEHKPYLVMLNDEKINREHYLSTAVRENDQIVLLPPIKGG